MIKQRAPLMRVGLGTIEMILVIIIMAVVFAAFLYSAKDIKETNNILKEDLLKVKLQRGIKLNFTEILDAYAPAASVISSDTSSNWGWKNSGLNLISPMPSFNGATKILTYNLNSSLLTSTQSSILRGTIIENLRGVCFGPTETSTTLNLFCPKIRSFNTTPALPVGGLIDPTLPLLVSVGISRETSIGLNTDVTASYRNQTYAFSLSDVYEIRRNISRGRMYELKKAIQSFYELKRSEELKNSPPNGLVSADDMVIPWFWEMYGDDKSGVYSSLCNTGGGVACTNLSSPGIWRNGTNSRGLYMRRIIVNLMNENPNTGTPHSIDGFNNAIFISPLAQGCTTGSDLFSCSISAPIQPREQYFTATGGSVSYSPPYLSILYIESQRNTSIQSPEYGRLPIFMGN